MAKTDSTKGKGAKDGEAKRATSGASPARSAAKKTAAKTPAKSATKSATGGAAGGAAGGGAGGGTTAGTGSTARKATSKRAGGSGTGGAGAGGATKKTAGKSTRSGGASAGAGGGGAGGGGLQGELRRFVSGRPQGWGHGDWLGLLDDLRGKGHDVSDTDAVGMALERERLSATLEGVEGLDAGRARLLVDRYQTLWSLRHAGVDQIADAAGVPVPEAERIKAAIG